jgi:2-iminoacetate synthase
LIKVKEFKGFLTEIMSLDSRTFARRRQLAAELTTQHFGHIRTLFNPIYVSNVCVNDCHYCGFRRSNREIERRTLTPEELLSEVKFLVGRNITKILLLAGEFHRGKYVEMLVNTVSTIRAAYPKIWLGLEAVPLELEEYRRLNSVGLDAVIIFQETYDQEAYQASLEDCDPKSQFNNRRDGLRRAIEAGIMEVGFGVLLGLANPLGDVVHMLEHANEIKIVCPRAKFRFSFPRLQLASAQQADVQRFAVTEDQVERLIVATRLVFPDARIVLTSRETQDCRLRLLYIATDIGEEGSTVVGGYTTHSTRKGEGQFELPGRGALAELREKMLVRGYVEGT